MLSAIGDSSQQLTLLQMLQQLQNSQATSESKGFAPPDESAMEEMRTQMDESVAEKLGMDSSTLTELHSQIQEAIQQAMTSSDGTEDMKATVDSAVDAVLEANGIDPAEFKSAMDSAAEELGMPAPGEMGPPPGSAGTYNAQGTVASSSSSQNDLLMQLLEALQSGSDSASSQSSSGFDILSWFNNLPSGSLANCYA
jgi:hypothetical protein